MSDISKIEIDVVTSPIGLMKPIIQEIVQEGHMLGRELLHVINSGGGSYEEIKFDNSVTGKLTGATKTSFDLEADDLEVATLTCGAVEATSNSCNPTFYLELTLSECTYLKVEVKVGLLSTGKVEDTFVLEIDNPYGSTEHISSVEVRTYYKPDLLPPLSSSSYKLYSKWIPDPDEPEPEPDPEPEPPISLVKYYYRYFFTAKVVAFY